MLIIDAHLDLAWNALQWNRDITKSVYTIRTQESDLTEPGRGQNTVAFPEMRQGRVAVAFATLLARSTGHPDPHIDYGRPAQAYGIAQGQLAYYHALAEAGQIRLISDVTMLNQHIAEWEQWETDLESGLNESHLSTSSSAVSGYTSPPLGLIISMESADPIIEPVQLEQWWQAGLRIIGPAHYGLGRYAGGTATEGGLTDLGQALLPRMAELGMILDMTHFSDQAFWQALNLFDGSVLASHNNCRALVPHQRQFNDDQLKAIIERDGVIGTVFDAWMLKTGWVINHTTNEIVSLNDVVNQIDYVCQLSGNSQHSAIGSDLDGGFGKDQSPHDLDTIADLQKLVGMLRERGYVETDIANIMHGNWLRLLRRSWAGTLV
ncbi:membrane dipeptidase [Anaerolineales bacterium HSG6]|nr:membrane dipeptidase [Anaerolineales bacterium HSG6]MDM8532677.1 membrane dipeptidase [Anaerolineales bacterium HSG25]